MILRNGVDLIEVERVQEAITQHGDRFLQRIFTAQEISLCKEQASSLAARFAAKEAVAKALGTGIGDVTWKDIEILRGPAGEPVLHLHNAAQQLAQALGLESWSISLSHTHTHALATVVASGPG